MPETEHRLNRGHVVKTITEQCEQCVTKQLEWRRGWQSEQGNVRLIKIGAFLQQARGSGCMPRAGHHHPAPNLPAQCRLVQSLSPPPTRAGCPARCRLAGCCRGAAACVLQKGSPCGM